MCSLTQHFLKKMYFSPMEKNTRQASGGWDLEVLLPQGTLETGE